MKYCTCWNPQPATDIDTDTLLEFTYCNNCGKDIHNSYAKRPMEEVEEMLNILIEKLDNGKFPSYSEMLCETQHQYKTGGFSMPCGAFLQFLYLYLLTLYVQSFIL